MIVTKQTKITSPELLRRIVYLDIIVCLYVEIIKSYSNIGILLNVVPDMLNCLAVLLMVKSLKVNSFMINKSDLTSFLPLLWIVLTSCFTLLSLSDNYHRFRYIIIGFVILYICDHYMNIEYWHRIVRLMSFSLMVHLLMCLYQFMFVTNDPDYINGIFGFTELNNAQSGTFCLIMAVIGIVSYIKKTLPVKQALSLIVMSSIVCAISEIKAFFVLAVIGAVLAFLLGVTNIKEFSRRIRIVIFGIIVGAIAIYVIYKIMPDNLYSFTSFSNWKLYEDYATYHIGIGVGRTNQLSYVYEKEFKSNVFFALCGKGLGYDASYIPYEMGRFYLNFGIIGLLFLMILLFSRLVQCIKNRTKSTESLICIICIVLFVIDMFIWNATFNRMAIIWFVLFSLLNFRREKNE